MLLQKVGKEGQSMEKLQIVYLPPGDLKPYEKNARKHAPDDIEAIKKSILEDGFNDPIGIWGEDNVIVEGHGRQIAATELGLDEVPCIRLDHLSDKQRREYMIRHNRVAELSSFDWEILREECARLSIEGQDFEELKFDFDNEIDFPENLDAEETAEHKIHVKLTFPDYQSFVPHEEELKDLAERIGAEYGLMKS